MAWRAVDAGGAAGGWGMTWKTLMYETLQATPLERRTYQSPLAGRRSCGRTALPVQSLSGAAIFPRRAVTGKALSTASKPPTESVSVARKTRDGANPTSHTEAVRAKLEGAHLLQNLSADAAIACLETIAVQCTTEFRQQLAEVLTLDPSAAISKKPAKNALEARASQKNSISTTAWAGGNAIAGARNAKIEVFVRDKGWGIMNGKEIEPAEIRAARVLLQVCMKKKESLSGRSVLKLLNAMLSLRLCNLENLTELADTIRGRLLRILPSDGLAAILCTYCYLYVTPRPLRKAAAVSDHVKCSKPRSAPVEGLISDAVSELCRRLLSRERNQGEGPAAITSRIDTCSAIPLLVNRRCGDLSSSDASRVKAAGGGTAYAALSESMEQDMSSGHDAQGFPTSLSSRVLDDDSSQDRLSHAGMISLAWGLCKVPFLRCSVLLRRLEKCLMPERLSTGESSPGFPQTSSRETRSAWKQELSRLQECGVTAAAFTHLPPDHTSPSALTAQREVVEALTNLRRLVLQNRDKLSNARHAPPVNGLVAHEQRSSAEAYGPFKWTFSLEDVVSEGLQAVQNPSLRCPADARQADSSTADTASKEEAVTMCPADAAIICGAVTSALRLSSIHQHNIAPILESVYLLHRKAPFMFLLPANQLCHFLAAAQEGLGRGLDVPEDGRTLVANAEPVMAAPSPRATLAAHSLQRKDFYCLLWALLLLPRITAAGPGLFVLMPSRILAVLLTLLSSLPGHLATYKHVSLSLHSACDLVRDAQTIKHDTERHFFSRRRKDAPLPMTQHTQGVQSRPGPEKKRTSSSPAEEDFKVQAFVKFETILRKFSSDLCGTIVQRTPCFREKDLVVSISAVKRLDGNARQLPISGQSWSQHPDFSRVLECLVRALRKWRQRAEERHQRCPPNSRHPAMVEIAYKRQTLEQVTRALFNNPLVRDCKQEDQSSPFTSVTTSVAASGVQHGDDSSDTASGKEQFQKTQQRSLASAAAEKGFSRSQPLSTSVQCDGLSDRGCRHNTEVSRASSTPTAAGDTEEEERVLHLVHRILRPCFLEPHLDKEDLRYSQASTAKRDPTAENSEKPSVTRSSKRNMFFIRRHPPSLLFESRTKAASGGAREHVNSGTTRKLGSTRRCERALTKALRRGMRDESESASFKSKLRGWPGRDQPERLQRTKQRARRKEDVDDRTESFLRA